uniref:Transcription factor protein n=1 Tax=Phallusia mammillata TaxID=59560 RepID=A0A6F9DF77_9ASCI|nr:transcription factor protein [Phallusia mammillata]
MAQQNQVVDSEYAYKAQKLCDETMRPFAGNQSDFSPQLSNFQSMFLSQYPASSGLLNNLYSSSGEIGNEQRDSSCTSVQTISLHNHRIPLQPNGQSNQQMNVQHPCGQQRTLTYSAGGWPDHASLERGDVQNPRSGNRGRTTYSDEQVAELEDIFARNPYPTPQARQQLSRDINVPESKIKIWFQNRRARAKKQRTGNSNWRNIRSVAVSAVKAGPNLNNNNLISAHGHNPKVQSFADKFLAMPTGAGAISDSSSKWQKEANTTHRGEMAVQQPSLSLSGLTIRPASNGVPSVQSGPSTSANTKLNHFQSHSDHKTSTHHPDFYYNPDRTRYAEHGGYYKVSHSENLNTSFPSRFPVISSANELHFFQSHLKNNFAKPGLAPHAAPRPSNPNPNKPCQYSNITARKSDICRTLVGSLQQNRTHSMSYIGSNAYSEDRRSCAPENVTPSMSATLFSSPPAIRRFVFPFKKLLESPGVTSDAGFAEFSKNNMDASTTLSRDYWNCRTSVQPRSYEMTGPLMWTDSSTRYTAMYSDTSNIPHQSTTVRNAKHCFSQTSGSAVGLSQVPEKENFILSSNKYEGKDRASDYKSNLLGNKVLTQLEDIHKTNENMFPCSNEPVITSAGEKSVMKVTISAENINWPSDAFQQQGQQTTKGNNASRFSSGGSDDSLCVIDGRKKSSPEPFTNWLKV